jgi:hypothetical protein
LDFFAATSSSSIGAGDNGGVIGMSASRCQEQVKLAKREDVVWQAVKA